MGPEVDAVMIDADIYGWATRDGALSELDSARLSEAADELERSIEAFPPDARRVSSACFVLLG